MLFLQGVILMSLVSAAMAGAGIASSNAERGDTAVVVYNARSADSRRVAEHYARGRGVPAGQLVGFDLPLAEEISRAEFQSQLQEPLFAWLVAQGLFTLNATNGGVSLTNEPPRVRASKIRYAVLCQGVPLKIRADATLVEDGVGAWPAPLRRNEAAVDSELVWLPRLREGLRLSGLLTNAFYGATNSAALHPTNGVLLVARLDGPNADVACGLVDKALEAEREGLWGRAYVDARGIKEGNYKLGDDLLRAAALMCSRAGYDVVVDLAPATFASEFPLSHVALYAGWYDGNVSGPFAQPDVEFQPGAFAYHLHSFSAATVRSTHAHWAGPLLAKGATVTLGSVYEPYLSGTSDVAILLRNWLLLGFSFGEAAWSGELGLSWQTTVVGDPLYRPWGTTLEARQRDLERRKDRRVEWAYALRADRQLSGGRPVAGIIQELRNLPLTNSSAVLGEKLGDLLRLQGKSGEALDAYGQALQSATSRPQRIRLLLAQADLQMAVGADAAELETMRRLGKESPAHAQRLGFQERLLNLAIRKGDVELTKECQATLRRLAGAPGTNALPSTAPGTAKSGSSQ